MVRYVCKVPPTLAVVHILIVCPSKHSYWHAKRALERRLRQPPSDTTSYDPFRASADLKLPTFDTHFLPLSHPLHENHQPLKRAPKKRMTQDALDGAFGNETEAILDSDDENSAIVARNRKTNQGKQNVFHHISKDLRDACTNRHTTFSHTRAMPSVRPHTMKPCCDCSLSTSISTKRYRYQTRAYKTRADPTQSPAGYVQILLLSRSS